MKNLPLKRLSCWMLLAALLPFAVSQAAEMKKPVKVFILAGQSNMEGQAVVDLKGPNYNDGKGTLAALFADPAKATLVKHLKNTSGEWKVRDDVWVSYQRENRPLLAGPLAIGFAVYGGEHHFGPELQFGHVLGDYFENPVLLIKTAWGGKSLYQDFRPPSAGKEVGKYYTLMISQVRAAIASMETDFPATKGCGYELAGFVWYHGWNDGVDPQNAVPEYESNLVHLIQDVRAEFKSPKLPVVIGELTGPWVKAEGAWEKLRQAQKGAASRAELAGNVRFVATAEFVRKPEDSPNPGHGHHEFGNAETYFLVGDALGKGILALLSPPQAATLKLSSPLEYQVVQRTSREKGNVHIEGNVDENGVKGCSLHVRLTVNDKAGEWRQLPATVEGKTFRADLEAPAGGWHRLELSFREGNEVRAEARVEHVGIGEVFVVAGQSNSANHGEEKQKSKSGKVATFHGNRWQLANDPQPGASGGGGSFLPPFGDAMASKFDVPIGFVSCGVGATSVREWLPKGTKISNPPTLTGNVRQLPGGEWECKGQIFESFVARAKPFGKNGFRAVLWHQGESDANQSNASRTLSGDNYRAYLAQLIRESRREIGWDAPWFVAQVSYHTPGDEASPDIRAAQASLWKDGLALEGPDSDALKGKLREAGGRGVHFSGPGLREHGARWVEKVSPWLELQLK